MAARGLWPKLKSEQESNNNDEREGKRRSGGPGKAALRRGPDIGAGMVAGVCAMV